MKKIYLTILLIALFSVNSCARAEDNYPTVNFPLDITEQVNAFTPLNIDSKEVV